MTPRTPIVSPNALRLVNAFALRVEDLAFLGAAPPDAHAGITLGHQRARNALLAYIAKLEKRHTSIDEIKS